MHNCLVKCGRRPPAKDGIRDVYPPGEEEAEENRKTALGVTCLHQDGYQKDSGCKQTKTVREIERERE